MNLIFLTYVNRSGSTFLSNELSKHKEIFVCPEAEILIERFLREPESPFDFINMRLIDTMLKTDWKLKYWGIKFGDLKNLNNAKTNFDVFLEILNTYKNITKPKADTIVFKGTELIYLYKILTKYNPELRFISIIRDGRASFTSQMTTISPYTNKPFLKNPLIAAWNWNKLVNLSLEFVNEKNFFIVKYEDLILDTKATLAYLFFKFGANLSISNRNDKGDLFKRLPESYRQIHNRIQDDPDKKRINLWKETGSQILLSLFERSTHDNMMKLNYDPYNYQINFMQKLVYTLYYRFHFLLVKIRLRLRSIKITLG